MDSVLDSNGSHELLRCSTEELALLRDAQLRSPPRRTSPRSPRSRLNSGDLREMKSAVREAVAEVRKASPRGGDGFFFSPTAVDSSAFVGAAAATAPTGSPFFPLSPGD